MQKKTIILIIVIVLLLIGGGVYWWLGNSQEKEPKTYSEVFNPPIDPNLEPEKHKEVYEKVQDIVHFPVLYPKTMPEGWKLASVESKTEPKESLGYAKITYQKDDQITEIFEGVGDIGMVENIGSIVLSNGQEGWLWKYGENDIGISIPNSSVDFNYFILGTNVSQEELLEIANLFVETK